MNKTPETTLKPDTKQVAASIKASASDYWGKAGAPKATSHWELPSNFKDMPYPKGSPQLPEHFSHISAQTGPLHDEKAHKALRADLESHGFNTVETHGKYGSEERGFLIPHDGSKAAKEKINSLGAKYKQHSVLHSSNLHNAFHYTSGERAGQTDQGGHGMSHGGEYDDYYSVLPSGHKYRLAIEPEEVKKADDRKPHYYGTMKGVHVFHGTHEDHIHLIGKHIHNPTNKDLSNAVNEANKQGTPVVIVHGAPPEALRVTISQALGAHKAGKIEKSALMASAPIGFKISKSLEIGDLEKHTYGSGNNSFHGWISPKGDLHTLKPDEYHEDFMDKQGLEEPKALQAGWIKVGSAGTNEVTAAESVLGNLKHPAQKKLREIVRNNVMDESFPLTVHHDTWADGDDYSSTNADTEHFIKHGKVKEGKLYRSESMAKAILQPDGQTRTDTTAHASALSALPEDLKRWGAEKLSTLPKDAIEQFELGGKTVKVRKLDADQYSGWIEHNGNQLFNFERQTMPEMMTSLQSKLELYNKEEPMTEEPKHDIKDKMEELRDKAHEALSDEPLDPEDKEWHDKIDAIKAKALLSLQEKKIHDLEELEEAPQEGSVSIPTADLAEGLAAPEEDCPACERRVDRCVCYAGLPLPQIEVDYKNKKINIMFKSEWASEDRENFIEDLKRRAGRILKSRK